MPAARIPQPLPSVEYLRECFAYDPDTGVLTWKERPREHFASARAHKLFLVKWAGKPAGGVSTTGYWYVKVDGRSYRAHRAVWALTSGSWPGSDMQIDHLDLDRTNNRIENLTLVTNLTNSHRQTKAKNNTSTVNGVGYNTDAMRWAARITVSGKTIFLGYYANFDEAVAARQAGNIHYGFADNHGAEKLPIEVAYGQGRTRSANYSGVIGCRFSARNRKWAAYITVSGKRIHLGYHPTLDGAAAARKAAELHYGVTNRSGRGKVVAP